MAFAFAPIGTWIDPLAAFAFTFRHTETPVCLHAFQIVLAFANHTAYMES